MRSKLFTGVRTGLLFLAFAQGLAREARAVGIEQVHAGQEATQAAPQTQPAWWAGFNEPALATLHEAIRARTTAQPAAVQAQADAQMLDLYVAARVLNVRLLLAQEFGALIDEQAQQSDAAPSAALAERGSRTHELAHALLQQRDAVVARLAEGCSMPAHDMSRVLAPSFALRTLPLFDAPLPGRLPRAILRERADVNVAESRLALLRKWPGSRQLWTSSEPAFNGWIEPNAPAVRAAFAAVWPDTEELQRVVAQAESEVRENLRSLQHRGSEAARWLEIARMRRIEFDAARRRAQLGAGSDQEIAEDYAALLSDNDQLAIAGGELAASWITLQLSTAGRALDSGGAARR